MKKISGKSCTTCVFFKDRDEKQRPTRIFKNKMYRCMAPVPDLRTILPESIVNSYGFDDYQRVRPNVSPDDGANCPTWSEYSKED